MPQPLRLGVGLDQLHSLLVAAGEAQVADGLGIDREETAGRPIFRRHVGDGGAIGEGESLEPGAEILDELAHHPLLAQELGQGEDEVGRGRPLLEPAGELAAHHLGNEHGDGLAQHGGLGLDPAHPPAEHGERVHHGRVAVGADEGVGIGKPAAVLLGGPHGLGEVLEVDLVADPRPRRHHAEIVEGHLAPAQELIALAVALELLGHVLAEGIGAAEGVHLHRVVDDEVDGDQRIDALGVAAELDHRIAHRGEIDDGGHAGEVLHQHARRTKGDLALGAALLEPGGDRADVLNAHRGPVLPTQEVLEQHLEREGEPCQIAETGLCRGFEAEIVVALGADGKLPPGLERILSGHGHEGSPLRGRSAGTAREGGVRPSVKRWLYHRCTVFEAPCA